MTSFSKCKLDMKFWILWIQTCRGTYIHIELAVFLWKMCPQKTQCVKNEVDMKWLWTGLPAPKGEKEKRGDSGFIHLSWESSSRENTMVWSRSWSFHTYERMWVGQFELLLFPYYCTFTVVVVQYLSYECTCYQKQWSDWSNLGSNK